jgi:hypothetical protein
MFEGDRLSFLMPFMEIRSLLTGARGISLPFTDQCTPYALDRQSLQDAVPCVMDYGKKAKWRYIEWRDAGFFPESVTPSEVYFTHVLDLAGTEADLFSRLADSNKRNIRKAVREGLTIKIQQSLDSLRLFYRLNCHTRKRHGLPPQPFSFFKNVFDHIISKGHGIVVSAFHSNEVIAASVYFHFGKQSIFKYGASDQARQNLRPNNLIMWEAIRWYRNRNYATLDLGRTAADDQGLLRYKRIWGTKESPLKYCRYDCQRSIFLAHSPRRDYDLKRLFARTPESILRVIGRLAYRHIG